MRLCIISRHFFKYSCVIHNKRDKITDMNIKKYIRTIALSISSLSLFATNSLAAIDKNATPPPINGDQITNWVNLAFDGVTAVLFLAVIVMGVLGSFMWMTSAGEPGKIKQAQGTLTWAVLGFVFFLLIRTLLFWFISSLIA